MVQIDDKEFKSALDEMRELLNWLTIMEKEYDFTPKDAQTTRKRLKKAVECLQRGLK